MKLFILSVLFFTVLPRQSHAETRAEILNRKTSEIIRLVDDGEIIKVMYIADSTKNQNGVVINRLELKQLTNGAYSMKSGRGLEMKIHRSLVRSSGRIGASMGETFSAIADECFTYEYDTGIPLLCLFPIPGFLVVFPAVGVGMGSATAATFLASLVVAPFEAIIEGSGKLLSRKKIKAKNAWNQALLGRTVTLKNNSFQKLLELIQEI